MFRGHWIWSRLCELPEGQQAGVSRRPFLSSYQNAEAMGQEMNYEVPS